MTLYLVAYLTNAHQPPGEPHYDICERRGDYWYSVIDDSRHNPYWTQELPAIPLPPEGWCEYLAEAAVKYATNHKSLKEPTLSALLRLGPKPQIVERR